ncbi:cellulosome protein [Acinetobacter baumannii]|uniref:sialate O-acetylesterase n=1 Tax=Acinetobacter baumannii TaxID=470 RepID=UPI000CE2FC4B|nr:sialate O-acetylesterase [Acinetobacter baumannii]PPC46166.1 cellulosome protein [Acinetobacter baumannii]
MTVPISDRLSQLYVGNGTNTRFDFTFRVFNQEDATGVAIRKKGATEFETVDPSTYTVTLNQDGFGGYVTFNTPPSSSVYFYIAGATPLDQLLDITNYDNFYPDAIERALDKLTALLQEWGTQLDQEKQARILADINYDSLAMEREENLENRLTSYINALIGITNPKVFDGITDRMVITKDGRTQREFNESVPFWTDDYVAFKQETYIREEKIIEHNIATVAEEQQRAIIREDDIYNDLRAKIGGLEGGSAKAYKTFSEAQSDTANIPANSTVYVTNDGDNTGLYNFDGVAFVKSDYDPVKQSNEFTKASISSLSQNLSEIKKSNEDSSVIPVLVDSQNKILIGYNESKDRIEAGGLQEQVIENFPNLMKSEDTTKVAVLTDSMHKILIGYDTEKDQAIIAGLELPNKKPEVAEVNHFVFDGQSLGIGATATTILSTYQPYFNVTFGTGPRMDSAPVSVIPLVEQFNSPASDGGTDRGETPCSGAANYASRAMMLENGINPKDHVIFCSAAGHGGYRIDQLEKGTTWYEFLLHHVSEAKRLNSGKTYKVQAIAWVQGENDAITGTQTSYELYRQKLEKLQRDANDDIKEITGQVDDIKFISYQLSYAARTWSAQALVQLHLAQESDSFALSTPMYHMPYAPDNIHLTNVGYKWMGAYFGRAYKQLIVDNRKPDFINPKGAQLIGDEIHIHFDVPKAPLVIDTTTLAPTTDSGFKVLVNDASATISSITAENDKVIIKISSTPAASASVKVRYALDYLGAGISITGGASGNLRDSTTDSIKIAGVERPLYHVCPHFELTAFTDKGI